MKHNKVIFVGSVLSDHGLTVNRGVSAAASQWSSGLLRCMKKNGFGVHNLSHVWNSTFPVGKIYPGDQDHLSSEFAATLVRYINIKWIRHYSLYRGLLSVFLNLIRKEFVPEVMYFYNVYPYNQWLAQKIRTLYPDIKLVLLVLDYDNPEANNWRNFKKQTKTFDGCVFLSWWAYQNAPIAKKIHIDAGWDGVLKEIKHKRTDRKNFVFVYAGKMERYGGINTLVEAIKLIPRQIGNVSFEFYGKGNSDELAGLANEDSRVLIRGFVSAKELEIAFESADAFLAPLDLSDANNRMVFPSKIMNYLRHRKPILASHSEGISYEYDKVLFYPQLESSVGWKSLIIRVMSLSSIECETVAEKTDKLLVNKKWKNHLIKLVEFVRQI